MQRAKGYLDQMACGIDPLSGQPIPLGELLHNARITRCLAYVSDILAQVIAQGGIQRFPEDLSKKQPFQLDETARMQFAYSDKPLSVTEFTKRINALIDQKKFEKLSSKNINTWLIQNGFLEEQNIAVKRSVKCPTLAGTAMGIQMEQRTGKSGESFVVLYPRSVQEFLLDHLDAMIEIEPASVSQKKENDHNRAEHQGEPWDAEQEEKLRELFTDGIKVAEIAKYMGRTRSGIQARLKRLGLIEKCEDAK